MGGDVNGLWKTSDGGKSWAFANSGLQNYGVYSIAVAPSDGRFVYALTQDGVAASSDGAATWTPCAETRNGALKVSANRGGSVKALAVDPRDQRTVYAGGATGRAVKSTDGGRTWTVLDYLSSRKPESGESAEPVSGPGADGWSVSPDANTKSITKSVSSSREPSVPAAGDPICCLAVSGADPGLVFLAQRKYGLFR